VNTATMRTLSTLDAIVIERMAFYAWYFERTTPEAANRVVVLRRGEPDLQTFVFMFSPGEGD